MEIMKSHLLKRTPLAVAFFLVVLMTCCKPSPKADFGSPDNRIRVNVSLSETGQPLYSILFDGKQILTDSKLGITMADEDFSQNLVLDKISQAYIEKDFYKIKTGKRTECDYTALKKTYTFKNPNGKIMEVQFQLSNNGIAFRYHFPNKSEEVKTIISESTSYLFPENTKMTSSENE